MAQKADGSIYINTAIETDGMKAGSQEVEAAVRRMAQTVSGIGNTAKLSLQKQTDAFVKQNQVYAQQEAKVESLKQKLSEMSEQKVETQEYASVNNQIKKLEASLDKAIEKQIKFVDTGGNTKSRAFQGMEYDIETISTALDEARRKKEQLEKSGGAYQAVDTSEIEQKLISEGQRLQQMNNSLGTSYEALGEKVESLGGSRLSGVDRLKNAMTDLGQAVINISSPTEAIKASLSNFAESVKDKAAGVSASIINGIAHPFQTVKKIAVPVLSKIVQLAKSAAKSIGGKLLSAVKKLGSAFLGLNKSTKKSNGSLGSSFKSLLKYGFGIRSLFVLFNRLRNALKEGFGNLAQYSDPVNKSLSSLKSSLTQLKNSFATAFAPILKVVAPVLKQFIDLVSQAVTYVGMFIAALTGQSTFTKAVAVQEDYAASLEGSAKAAKDAEKATNGYLSGLDEIKRFEEPNTSDSGSSGGAGSANPQDMFETVPLGSMVSDFAARMKEAWENADFTEIGTIIGGKLNDALQNISWDSIKTRCNKIASSIATFINGFVETPDLWVTIGTTIGEGINTAVGMWNTFFDTTNFVEIGSAIAVGLVSALSTIDPTELGRSLSQKIRALIEAAYGFVTKFDWGKFGTWLSNALNGFINNIPLDTLGKTLGSALTGIFDTAINFAETFDWIGLGDKISGGINGLFETFDGGKLAEGASKLIIGLLDSIIVAIEKTDWGEVWKDIIDFLANIDLLGIIDKLLTACIDLIAGLVEGLIDAIVETDWAEVWDHFMNALKDFFGIHSPSTLMAEQGGFLIAGLLQGLKQKFADVKQWLSELPATFKLYFDQAKTKITETFSNIGTWFKEKFSSAWTNIKNAFSSVGSFFAQIWNGIKNTFSNVGTWFQSKFTDAWTKVKNVFSTGGKIFDGIKDGILSGLKSVINGIIKGINKVISVPFNGLNNTLNRLRKIEILGAKPFGWVSTFKVPQIPYLAKGAVIPPNAPFMAMLGDQRRGKNIEAPEDLIRKIVREETAGSNQGFNGTIRVPVNLDGRQILEVVIDQAMLRLAQSGRSPFELA